MASWQMDIIISIKKWVAVWFGAYGYCITLGDYVHTVVGLDRGKSWYCSIPFSYGNMFFGAKPSDRIWSCYSLCVGRSSHCKLRKLYVYIIVSFVKCLLRNTLHPSEVPEACILAWLLSITMSVLILVVMKAVTCIHTTFCSIEMPIES